MAADLNPANQLTCHRSQGCQQWQHYNRYMLASERALGCAGLRNAVCSVHPELSKGCPPAAWQQGVCERTTADLDMILGKVRCLVNLSTLQNHRNRIGFGERLNGRAQRRVVKHTG